jgi:ketosteroid isomerase-like protein
MQLRPACPALSLGPGCASSLNRKENEMADTTFEDFLSTREQAAEAYVRGDGTRVDALVPHDGTASFHSPRGDTVIGAQNVATRYLKDAEAFHSQGTSRFEVIQKGQDGDLGFWTGFQVATVQIGNAPRPQNMRIRVTELFRKIEGKWRLVHRHADAPPS